MSMDVKIGITRSILGTICAKEIWLLNVETFYEVLKARFYLLQKSEFLFSLS